MAFGTSEREVTHVARVGAHSHVRGLGVDSRTLVPAESTGDGLVGQAAARRAAAVIVRLVQEGRIGGRGVLLSGPPGSGKTALACAMAAALGADVPFVAITGSEVFALGLSKTEALTQALRRAVAVRVREDAEIISGEVVDIVVETAAPGVSGASRGRLTLRTTDMEAAYELGERMVEALAREQVAPGDVVSIDRANGRVSRLGRSFSRAREFGSEGGAPAAGAFVACPEGELQQRRETTHTVSLHEIDVVNGTAGGAGGFLALFSGQTGEIGAETRAQVNARVFEWRSAGRAVLAAGVLLIDEAHMLDVECFAFMNRAMEDELAPLVVLVSNRGTAPVRGDETHTPVPHGMPADLLDRLLVVATEQYTPAELASILRIRAVEEDVSLSDAALASLASLASAVSLRHAMQLLTVAHHASLRRGASTVDPVDVERATSLFADETYSLSAPQ